MNVRIPYKQEFDHKTLLTLEKDATGMYLSGHPLSPYSWLMELMHTKKIGSILADNSLKDGMTVKLICSVERSKLHVTKNGDKMSFVQLSDDTGEIEAVVFPDLYMVSGSKLVNDAIVYISGKISVKDDRVTVICGFIGSENEFTRLVSTMKLCIKTTSSAASVSDELRQLCERHKGDTAVCFYLTDVKKTVSPRVKLSLSVNENSYEELKELCGAANIGLIS